MTVDPYGNLTSKTGTADTQLRWNGQYQDTDTGHYYLRARYYDPLTAQFLSVDPMVAITQSSYGYAGANPLTYSDPTGLCWPSWACGAENAVVGASQAAWQWGVDHRGAIASGVAIGVCLTPGLDLVGCGVAGGIAYSIRAQQRVQEL